MDLKCANTEESLCVCLHLRHAIASSVCNRHVYHSIPLSFIEPTDRPFKKSSGGEGKGEGKEEGNRCSKTVCPLSALLLFQITPQAVDILGKTVAYWVSWDWRVPVMHACSAYCTIKPLTAKRPNIGKTHFQVALSWLFMLQPILKHDPPNPDIRSLLAVKIPIWWKD